MSHNMKQPRLDSQLNSSNNLNDYPHKNHRNMDPMTLQNYSALQRTTNYVPTITSIAPAQSALLTNEMRNSMPSIEPVAGSNSH